MCGAAAVNAGWSRQLTGRRAQTDAGLVSYVAQRVGSADEAR